MIPAALFWSFWSRFDFVSLNTSHTSMYVKLYLMRLAPSPNAGFRGGRLKFFRIYSCEREIRTDKS